MPLQNRVTPFGALIATESRGTLMGNRGCLHDEQQRIRRPFVGKRWIICVLEFRGRHRAVMSPGRYTELFFLDEATALAAGHRPCAECQRSATFSSATRGRLRTACSWAGRLHRPMRWTAFCTRSALTNTAESERGWRIWTTCPRCNGGWRRRGGVPRGGK